VPEIDVPGHATAFLASYPELGSIKQDYIPVGERWGMFPATLNPVSTEVDTFLEVYIRSGSHSKPFTDKSI